MPTTQSGARALPLVLADAAIYRGGGLFTQGALAVHGDRITQIGPTNDVLATVPADTRVIDLAGGTVLPGFQDAHVHPVEAGLGLLGIDLLPVHSAPDYLRIIADFAQANPDAPILEGSGFFGDAFHGGLPHRNDLDRIVPDRPVVIFSHDHHGVWVNSVALERAGIDSHTADPATGRVVRDADGRPTGVLLDGAVELLGQLRTDPDPGHLRRALVAAQQRLLSFGVTAWQDAAVGESFLGPDTFGTYEAMAVSGELTARVVTALWWDANRGLEQIEELVQRRERARLSGAFDAGTVKVMQDGMIENGTAAMIEPYCGQYAGERGESFIDPDDLRELSIRLDALGFQIHYHAVGDRAARECLDAAQAAQETNGVRDSRHQIAHLDVVDPEDFGRFAELGVSANIQMLWARRDNEIVERKLPLMGAAREEHHFPFRELRDSGATLSAGSDWPVTDPNPLWAIHTAVHRTAPPGDVHAVGVGALSDPLESAQALTFAEGLDAYTVGAAHANRLDRDTGVLRPGALADIAVLDRDIREGVGIAEASVVGTWIDGVQVYER